MRPIRIFAIAMALLLLAPIVALAAAKTTISVWFPEGDIAPGTIAFADKNLFAEFEAKNNVKIEMVALDYDTMIQKIFAAAAGKNVGDILLVDMSWIPGFLKEDMLEPVADAKAKAWLAATSPEVKTLSDYGKGRMWGYPQFGIEIYGLTWNKDHFKDAGLDPEKPPKTWDEFRDYAKKLTKRDAQGNTTRVGYAIRHVGQPHGIVHKHWWALYGAGAALVEDPLALRGGKVKFNNEAGKASIQLILDMLDVDKSTSLSFPDPRAAFLQGIASMQISETVAIKARQPKEAPNLKWGMALPPSRRAGDKPVTLMGAWMFVVPKQSKNKALAWKALEWFNSPEKDFELSKKYNATPLYKANWDKEPFKSDPYAQGLKRLYVAGISYPMNLGFNGIMDAMGAAIQKAWHHEGSVDAALAEAERLGNQAITEAAK